MTEEGRPRAVLMSVLVLVGALAATFRGLQWYSDHLDRLSYVPQRRATPGPRPTSTPSPVPTEAPSLPLSADILALASREAATQSEAIERLRRCQMTSELADAVAKCRPATPFVASRLDCLWARVPGAAAIDRTIERLKAPFEESSMLGPEDKVCLVETLADRIGDDPDRVAQALFPFAMRTRMDLREPALRGLAQTRFALFPTWAEAHVEGSHRRGALDAAFAMRVEELAPHLVERWVMDGDERFRATARFRLVESRAPGAARILVGLFVTQPEDQDLLQRFQTRERSRGDAVRELVEIAADESRTRPSRVVALERLGTLGGIEAPKHIARLAPLRQHHDEVLRSYAAATLDVLEKEAKRRGMVF